MANEVKIKLTESQKAKIKSATGREMSEIRVGSLGGNPAVSASKKTISARSARSVESARSARSVEAARSARSVEAARSARSVEAARSARSVEAARFRRGPSSPHGRPGRSSPPAPPARSRPRARRGPSSRPGPPAPSSPPGRPARSSRPAPCAAAATTPRSNTLRTVIPKAPRKGRFFFRRRSHEVTVNSGTAWCAPGPRRPHVDRRRVRGHSASELDRSQVLARRRRKGRGCDAAAGFHRSDPLSRDRHARRGAAGRRDLGQQRGAQLRRGRDLRDPPGAEAISANFTVTGSPCCASGSVHPGLSDGQPALSRRLAFELPGRPDDRQRGHRSAGRLTAP